MIFEKSNAKNNFMMELIALIVLAVCIAVITIVVRIYKESPKIRKNIDPE